MRTPDVRTFFSGTGSMHPPSVIILSSCLRWFKKMKYVFILFSFLKIRNRNWAKVDENPGISFSSLLYNLKHVLLTRNQTTKCDFRDVISVLSNQRRNGTYTMQAAL